MWVWGPYYLKRFKISSSHVPNSPDGSPPNKKDYDVGDKELLAIKLSLEEWHHWLEQAEHPFLIWTDHKNLTYLKSAKRFNFPQARWSLLFARFNFSVSYGPGSRNINLNTLSHQSSPDLEPQDPATFPLPAGPALSPGRLRRPFTKDCRKNLVPKSMLHQRNPPLASCLGLNTHTIHSPLATAVVVTSIWWTGRNATWRSIPPGPLVCHPGPISNFWLLHFSSHAWMINGLILIKCFSTLPDYGRHWTQHATFTQSHPFYQLSTS